jgi:hypothetical protein
MDPEILDARLAHEVERLGGPKYEILTSIIQENLPYHDLHGLPQRFEEETSFQRHIREAFCEDISQQTEKIFLHANVDSSLVLPHILYRTLREYETVSIHQNANQNLKLNMKCLQKQQADTESYEAKFQDYPKFQAFPNMPTWTKRTVQTYTWRSQLGRNMDPEISQEPAKIVQTRIVPDPILCLDHLLKLLPSKVSGRYADALHSAKLADVRFRVLEAIRPQVMTFCRNGLFSKDS